MNTHPARYALEEDLDWEIVPLDWWKTSFFAVSWSHNSDLQVGNSQRSHFRGSLFLGEGSGQSFSSLSIARSPGALSQSRRSSEDDDDLNNDLVGVKLALEAVVAYEKDVGFDFLDLGVVESTLKGEVDLSSDIDEKALQMGKDQWNEMLEELINGPVFESTTDSDESLESSYMGSISSYGSVDSIPMPSTPKPKTVFGDVEIKTSSPRGSPDGSRRSHTSNFSPTRSLNATASSFVPTFCSQLSEEPSQFALLQDNSASSPSLLSPPSSFSNFTFPTLNLATPAAVKIKKDDQGFFTDPQVDDSSVGRSSTDLLPAFLQESSQRNRSRKSRTREIVDKLRSQTAPDFTQSSPNLAVETISPSYASLNPSPTSKEATAVATPRLSVSEDGGGPSRLSTPWDDDDGWIDITQPVAIPPAEQKSKRTRELFLALTRRRTDSPSSGDHKETSLAPESASSHSRDKSTSVSPSPSPSPSPPSTSNATANSDGWIESKPTPVPEPQKKTKAASSSSNNPHSHSRKRSSHHNSRTSISSTASSHLHTPFSAASSCYPQLQPTLIPQPHPQHIVSPHTAAFPYFFPAYPAVPMSSPYATAFMQMPGYPMGMNMHGHSAHLVPTAGTVVHPMAGLPYVMPALAMSTKPSINMSTTTTSSSHTTTSHRAKHTPLW